MKKFEEPKLNVEMIEIEDVITTSQTCDSDCGVDTGNGPCEFDLGGF